MLFNHHRIQTCNAACTSSTVSHILATTLSSLLAIPAVTLAVPAEKGGDGWTVEVGFGGEWEPRYAGSEDRQFEPDPYINIAWRNDRTIWYTSLLDYGVYHSLSPAWLVGLSAGLEQGREEDDDPALQGLGQIDDTWELRLDVAYRMSDALTLGARAMTAGAEKDNVYFIAAFLELPAVSERMDWGISADVSWGSRKHLQTEFGVTPEQSLNSAYPEYSPEAGLKSYGIGINGRFWLDHQWFVYSELSYEHYDSAGANSPFVANDYDYEGEIGIAYRF